MAAAVLTAHPARIRRASARCAPERGHAGPRVLHDLVFRWGYPDDERRAQALPGFFALYAEALLRHDETYVVGRGDGVALWALPDASRSSPSTPTSSCGAWRRWRGRTRSGCSRSPG